MRAMTDTRREQGSFYWKMLMGMALVALLMVMMAARPAHASTTFTVNTTADSADGDLADNTCDAEFSNTPFCTLRAAIQQANATPGADTIEFAIPTNGVATIHVNLEGNLALPTITDPVTIDGYSQSGASPNTLIQGDNAAIKIDLDGSLLPSGNGLDVRASNTTIRGLAIHDFVSQGESQGINIVDSASATTGVHIEGNFIGTGPGGAKDRGNKYAGVLIDGGHDSGGHVIGGPDPADRNVISGNKYGIFIDDSSNNVVQGNYIGTDRDGTDSLTSDDMGNYFGGVICFQTDHITIGGSAPGQGNVISNSSGDGVSFQGSTEIKVLGNLIGTDRTGTKNLGNGDGIYVYQSTYTQIGDGTQGGSNAIAYNTTYGVAIRSYVNNESTAHSNRINRNSIFSNGGLGIDLVGPSEVSQNGISTPNDAGDVDFGPNNLQNKPILSSAKKNAAGKTDVKATLNSTPNTTFTIQFFKNPHGTNEGKTFLGSITTTTDGSGNVSFTFATTKKVGLGQNMTATATTNATGDTSEFSVPRKVVAL
jgi:CSLREA domain-containing protein